MSRHIVQSAFNIFNGICVEDLGFDASLFPTAHFDLTLKERELNDILHNEFQEEQPKGLLRCLLINSADGKPAPGNTDSATSTPYEAPSGVECWGIYCLIMKKVDSKQRVNNVSITHGKTAPVL